MGRRCRGIGVLLRILIVAVLLCLLAAPAARAEEGAAAPEEVRCAGGYAYDGAAGECLRCNAPCKTELPGLCGRGIVACEEGAALCRATARPGERRELCNGEDDDCDGRVDEDFDKDADGYTTCSGDCNDRDPSIHPDAVERCDSIDNNCNGLVDEGFNVAGICTIGAGACTRQGRLHCAPDGMNSLCDAVAGGPSPETCDGIDNDCNGKADDGLGEISCGAGACRRTVPACAEGRAGSCAPAEPGPELCGNGIDDNCNGKTDEGFIELGRSCSEGVGACRTAGKFVCNDDLLTISCSARAAEPRAEICGNRIDDDCDGTIDTDAEGLGTACTSGLAGACSRDGTMVCDKATGAAVCNAPRVAPVAERCNGIDDDCDGAIDNGVLNACGGCGELPGGIGGPCTAEGGDECATGRWACRDDGSHAAVCLLDTTVSEGRSCAADGNSCTRDLCQQGRCIHPAAANGLACDDGDRCGEHDTCIDGLCAGGVQLACDDGNACTADTCEPAIGCVHALVGGGELNACGGCEQLEKAPGSACELAEQSGPCREGRGACQPDGGMDCVQTVFGRAESCNTIDDDCDGRIDDDLGQTTCGIGACSRTIDNCAAGASASCVPGDPQPESCANAGADDDCNGVPDDIAGFGAECAVTVGTCIIPGARQCVGDAATPVCVPVSAHDAEDEDGNGVANYCDHGATVASSVAAELGALAQAGASAGASSHRFDAAKTRAAMMPWSRVVDAAVIHPASAEQAILLVSGSAGGAAGLAVMRAKDVSQPGTLTFQTCTAEAGRAPELMAVAGDGASLFATSAAGYLRYPKIGSQIPSPLASLLRCSLRAEPIALPAVRAWPLKNGTAECVVERIAAIENVSAVPLVAGAPVCALPAGSILSRQRRAVGLDLLAEDAAGGVTYQFVPVAEAAGEVERVTVAPLAGGAIFVAAAIGGRTHIGLCTGPAEGWRCSSREAPEIAAPIVAGLGAGDASRAQVLAIGADGSAYDLAESSFAAGGKALPAGSANVRGVEEGGVGSAILLPLGSGGSELLLGRDERITAAALGAGKEGGLALRPLPGERLEPAAPTDDIATGGKFSFGRPQALAILPLKRSGGLDLFAAFEIREGGRAVGAMGFFGWNANEPPEGTISEVHFDGHRGRARFAFTDSTGDAMTYRASIRAAHGGSLANWIDAQEKGELRFSVKGDASAVGIWPIEITIEAQDAGGAGATARAVLRRDGAIDAITESSGTP